MVKNRSPKGRRDACDTPLKGLAPDLRAVDLEIEVFGVGAPAQGGLAVLCSRARIFGQIKEGVPQTPRTSRDFIAGIGIVIDVQ